MTRRCASRTVIRFLARLHLVLRIVDGHHPCLTRVATLLAGNELGEPVPIDQAADHIFGFVLLNDWSARDLQQWEYVPLGPFTAKSFATSISPWVVTWEALMAVRCDAPEQTLAPVLPYLTEADRYTFDVNLDVALKPKPQPSGCEKECVVARSNLKHLYWTPQQMVAHHTVTGCNLRPGDLLGTGTISAPEGEGTSGSLLELSRGGMYQINLEGEERHALTHHIHPPMRAYLEDGDEVVLRGTALRADGIKIGFGECRSVVLPAKTPAFPAPSRGDRKRRTRE